MHSLKSLTLLLSYSLRDSENNLALEIDIPQNGRYICSTWVKAQKMVKDVHLIYTFSRYFFM